MENEMKELRKKLEEITVRLDLVFSTLSNSHLASQAMSVHSHMAGVLDKTPEDENLKSIVEKAQESYKFHSSNINDAISYYYDIFGEEANLGVHDLMKKKGIPREGKGQETPDPVAPVSANSKRTSEVSDVG